MFLSCVVSHSYASLSVSGHVQSPGLTIQEYDFITWNTVLIYHGCSLCPHVFKNQQKIPPYIVIVKVLLLRSVMLQDRQIVEKGSSSCPQNHQTVLDHRSEDLLFSYFY